MHATARRTGDGTGRRGTGACPMTAYDPTAIAWRDSTSRALGARNDDILAPVLVSRDGAAGGADDALQRAGLVLRPWLPFDLPAYHALLDDPQVWALLPEPYPDPLDLESARLLITTANTLPGNAVRALTRDGQPIGQLRLEWAAGKPRHEAELSYWLGRAHWGGGAGSAMVAGAVARAFGNDPGLLRLTARVHPDNPASARALQKAGFSELAAPPAGRGVAGWRWFALRRQHRR